MQHACIKLQKTKICLQCRCFVDTWAELEETSGTDISFLEAQQVHSQYSQLARHSVSWLNEEKWRNSRWTSQNNTSALLYVSIKQSRLKILRYPPLFILRLKFVPGWITQNMLDIIWAMLYYASILQIWQARCLFLFSFVFELPSIFVMLSIVKAQLVNATENCVLNIFCLNFFYRLNYSLSIIFPFGQDEGV